MSQPAAALCKNRGCGNPVAGPRFTACGPCLMGNRPAMRRKVAAAAAVEAMPAMPAEPGAWAFRVPGSPMSVNRAWRAVRGRGAIRKAPEALEWQRAVRLYAARARPAGWDLAGTFEVEVRSIFARHGADADNPVKLVLDALQGLAFANDSQVTTVTARKAVDPAAARLECVIRRLP